MVVLGLCLRDNIKKRALTSPFSNFYKPISSAQFSIIPLFPFGNDAFFAAAQANLLSISFSLLL